MIRKPRQSQKENYIHVLQEKERKTNQKTDTQQYFHVRLSNQRFITNHLILSYFYIFKGNCLGFHMLNLILEEIKTKLYIN